MQRYGRKRMGVGALVARAGVPLVIASMALGGCSKTASSATPAPAATVTVTAAATPAESAPMGRQLFGLSCAACHGQSGQGIVFTIDNQTIHVPALSWSDLSKTYSIASRGSVRQQLESAIMLGQNEKGEPLEKMMPRWRLTLTKAQVDSIIEFIAATFK